MKHNIRIKDGVIPVDCELGTGLYDCTGREIFAGDVVKFDGDADTYRVTYADCAFWLDKYPLFNYIGSSFEIVGHVGS